MSDYVNHSVWRTYSPAGQQEALVRIIQKEQERVTAQLLRRADPTFQAEDTLILDERTVLAIRDVPDNAYGYQYDFVCAVTLPEHLVTSADWETLPRWWIALEGLNPDGAPLGLEILGDVVLGRSHECDLNLSGYGGYAEGVSRQHALLRPTASRLFIIDLESTNGTQHNALRLGCGQAREVRDGDTISLGSLTFRIRIVRSPRSSLQ